MICFIGFRYFLVFIPGVTYIVPQKAHMTPYDHMNGNKATRIRTGMRSTSVLVVDPHLTICPSPNSVWILISDDFWMYFFCVSTWVFACIYVYLLRVKTYLNIYKHIESICAITRTHMRKDWRLMGDLSHFKTRLSNAIAMNAAALLKLACRWRPRVWIIAEQPKGSYMFKSDMWQAIIQEYFLYLVLTYLGFFGMDILKGTHLRTTLPMLVFQSLEHGFIMWVFGCLLLSFVHFCFHFDHFQTWGQQKCLHERQPAVPSRSSMNVWIARRHAWRNKEKHFQSTGTRVLPRMDTLPFPVPKLCKAQRHTLCVSAMLSTVLGLMPGLRLCSRTSKAMSRYVMWCKENRSSSGMSHCWQWLCRNEFQNSNWWFTKWTCVRIWR